MRVIVLVPKEVTLRVGCCKHKLMRLCRTKKIPHMFVSERPNFYNMMMDRACTCDCANRYEYRRIKKEDINTFMDVHSEDFLKIFDADFEDED